MADESSQNQEPDSEQDVLQDGSPETEQSLANEQDFADLSPEEVEQFDGEIEPGIDEVNLAWTASEYVAHRKDSSWFLTLAVLTVMAVIVVFLLMHDLVACGVIIFAAIVLGYFANQPPRELEYSLDRYGITIGDKHYEYQSFRSFSVVPEGAFSSITFMPLKRFAPPLSIYYPPDDEEEIIAVLADRLPLEEHRPDTTDRLVRRIRF